MRPKNTFDQAIHISFRLNPNGLICRLAQKWIAAPFLVALVVFPASDSRVSPGNSNFNVLGGGSLPQKNETNSETNFDLLIDAIHQGNIVTIKKVLLQKVDVNGSIFSGNTPLHLAAANNG